MTVADKLAQIEARHAEVGDWQNRGEAWGDAYADVLESSVADVPALVAALRGALAAMDWGMYGDPEVPFRMRAAIDGALR